MRDLGRQVAVLDIRLLRTLPRLFFSPGRLTAEYVAGRRLAYTSPIRLYIAASAVVLAVMSLSGVTDLDALLANQTEEDIAALEEVLGADLRDPAYQARFNQRLDTIYPIVNLFTPVAMMLMLKLVYWRRYLEEHLAFGCHYGTFLSIIGMPMLTAEGIAHPIVIRLVAIVSLFYLLVAMRRVYGGGWPGLIARFVAFSLGFMGILAAVSLVTLTIVLVTTRS
ncbi:MAG: DUF3667 domain-containing protein [Acidobacteriota bacterium]|nr:DUF3667 domain-containing protein [Acidobacteriota bacterium]